MKKFLLVFLWVLAAPPLLALDDHNPIGVTGAFEGVITTGCAYNVLNHSATRQIDDIVVPGSIRKYPLKITRYYNSRAGYGDGWSLVSTDGARQLMTTKSLTQTGPCRIRLVPEEWGVSGSLGVSDGWETHPSYGNGNFRLPDGGTVVFQNHRATSIIDPHGHTTSLTYDANGMHRSGD